MKELRKVRKGREEEQRGREWKQKRCSRERREEAIVKISKSGSEACFVDAGEREGEESERERARESERERERAREHT